MHTPQENTALIKEINELRREARALRARGASGAAATAGSATALAFSKRPTTMHADAELVEGLRKELEMQRWVVQGVDQWCRVWVGGAEGG